MVWVVTGNRGACLAIKALFFAEPKYNYFKKIQKTTYACFRAAGALLPAQRMLGEVETMEFHQHPPERGCHDWRKHSRCSAGNCVEVNLSSDVVRIRDSKLMSTPEGSPIIGVERSNWEDFIGVLTQTDFGHCGPLQALQLTDGTVILSSSGTELTFDDAEWSAFLEGVRAGEFNPALVSA